MLVAFSHGHSGVSDASISDLILGAFDSCESGSTVWGSMFRWTDVPFTRQLAPIVDRGRLHLNLVAGDSQTEVPDEIRDFASRHIRLGGIVKVRPDGKRNHGKWFMFEEIDFDALAGRFPDLLATPFPAGIGQALYVATGHPTSGDPEKDNAAVLIPIDETLAAPLRRFFAAIHAAYLYTGMTGAVGRIRNLFQTPENGRFKLYFYPRSPFNDTIVNVLENIQSDSAPKVRIVTPRWTSPRRPVADELGRIFKKNDASQIDYAGRGRMHLRDTDDDGDGDAREMGAGVERALRMCSTRWYQKRGASIHSKYLQLEGLYRSGDGFSQQKLTWIGSPTLSGSAVDGSFELLVKLKDEPDAFERFALNFDLLKAESTSSPRPIGVE